jgi:hypothetical protein
LHDESPFMKLFIVVREQNEWQGNAKWSDRRTNGKVIVGLKMSKTPSIFAADLI